MRKQNPEKVSKLKYKYLKYEEGWRVLSSYKKEYNIGYDSLMRVVEYARTAYCENEKRHGRLVCPQDFPIAWDYYKKNRVGKRKY